MTGIRDAARAVLEYLAETPPPPTTPFDAVIGFGVFDLRLPRLCGDLYAQGLARRIIFTGGVGAGTGDLGGPEADVWQQALTESHPQIPAEDVIVENRSTNTAENITFTAELLRQSHPRLAFGTGITNVLAVSSPSRLRRVRLTLAKLQPRLDVVGCLPPFTLEREQALYQQQGLDYLSHLAGEVDRIVVYGQRGWIAQEAVPAEIAAAAALLARKERD